MRGRATINFTLCLAYLALSNNMGGLASANVSKDCASAFNVRTIKTLRSESRIYLVDIFRGKCGVFSTTGALVVLTV